MAGAVPLLDEIIKEYLLFRGFTNTLKSFESDLKSDKDKSFKVTRITDQLIAFIASYDVSGLKDYWNHLDKRFFQRLDYQHYASVKKMETCLFRLYIVHALQNSKQDKVVEFFEKYASELQQKSEWREWFAIPFIKYPEQNALFEMYFSRSWQDTFLLSLHNFLITIFHYMPMPTLIKLDEERGKLKRLEKELEECKEEVNSLREEKAQLHKEKANLNEMILQERQSSYKTQLVDDDEADEFFVVSSKPSKFMKQVKQMKDNFHIKRNPGRTAKTKETKSNNKPFTNRVPFQDDNQMKMKKQLPIKQQFHDEQRVSEMLEDDQSKEIQEGKQTDPDASPREDQVETTDSTEKHEIIRKARSFDSSLQNNTDEMDNPNNSTRTYSLPAKDLKKPNSVTKGKNAETSLSRTVSFFEEETKNKAFLRLGQEEYKEHHSAIIHCRFSASGRKIASADADGIVKVWTNHPEIETCGTVMSSSPFLSLEWATKRDYLLLLGTRNGRVHFHDTDKNKKLFDVSTEPQYPRVVSISCCPTGKGFVCSATTAPKSHSHRVSSSTALSSEMSNITGSSCGSGVLQYWDIKEKKMERQLPLEPIPTCVNCTAFNHNGILLVSGASDGMIRLFDMGSYECLNAWQAHMGEVCSILFSVDETTIYSMGSDGKFCQWSLHRMGQKLADLDIHEGAVWCGTGSLRPKSRSSAIPSTYGRLFAFDSEGQYVLTCGQQCGVIYHVDKEKRTLNEVMSLQDHRSAVVSVDWTSSQSYCTLLTGSVDGSIGVASLLKQ